MRLLTLLAVLLVAGIASAQKFDKQKLLEAQTFWDNKDWDWYKQNIPFFDCPDPDLVTTYYYRWELLTKHLTYGSPNGGYSFTEFIDRPFWSVAYGSISCPAGLQLYEARWLRDSWAARDYLRYWFKTAGAEPRRYSTWLADAAVAVDDVMPFWPSSIGTLLPDLVKNFEAWEKEHFDKDVGLFWQTGHDDGMEFNINSRQTQDIVRGAPAYRPTLNSYMYADALAIARIADRKGEGATADLYRKKAAALKDNVQKKLWDPKRQFFFPMAKRDEERDGFKVKAASLTYQTGQFAGNEHGRELIGYVPWQFNLPDPGYEAAWKPLMDTDGFLAPFGPTTVERKDPLFKISPTCCWWSGNSWPYATSQTLTAMANLLQNYKQDVVTKDDYIKLLTTYAKTHRKNGKPYIAEACNPDTGSWQGHDSFNHSEHYFHSNYIDLIITGLIGLRPQDDWKVHLHPLVPDSWDYFALVDVPFKNFTVSVYWDRTGNRYGLGKGMHVIYTSTHSFDRVKPVAVGRGGGTFFGTAPRSRTNFAVNNDGAYFPRVLASFTGQGSSTSKLIDGNYWYHVSPPNRWTCEGSPNKTDWCAIDFGVKRKINKVMLYVLDDGEKVTPPQKIRVEYWNGKDWKPVSLPYGGDALPEPRGREPYVIVFPTENTQKIRALLTHRDGSRSGLSEFEAWGEIHHSESDGNIEPAPMPAGNFAFNPDGKPFPKASASFTSRFDKVEFANDGKVNFAGSPNNRWTSYESPNASDWLEIDFGVKKTFRRVELAIYDDRGGVQAPASYDVQIWAGTAWQSVPKQKKSPEKPVGGQFNEVAFDAVTASKVRVVFTHPAKARSGVSEMFVWEE
ncbi:MAG TPA: discoidin domain-containing protein [Gemmataceae bacterium]|nr:discoidin domain-containing protein [Gemmataceae bacterium]